LEVRLKKIRMLLFCILLVLGFLFALYFVLSKENQRIDQWVVLDKKTVIENYAKIDVLLYKSAFQNDIQFVISIESYQNKDIIDYDLVETALMEDDKGTLYKPSSWRVLSKTEYKVQGELVFSGLRSDIREIKLIVFGMGGKWFRWKI